LQVSSCRSEAADLFLDVGDLIEKVILLALESNAPVECQSEGEREALDHGHWVDGDLASLSIVVELLDKVSSLDIEVIDVSGHRWSVEGRSSALATALERVAVGRRAYCGSSRVREDLTMN
jgi:hypothetical protein